MLSQGNAQNSSGTLADLVLAAEGKLEKWGYGKGVASKIFDIWLLNRRTLRPQPHRLKAYVPMQRPSEFSPPVAHSPDGAVAIFAEKEAAVSCDGDSDRSTPDIPFARDEAGNKILVLAACFAG